MSPSTAMLKAMWLVLTLAVALLFWPLTLARLCWSLSRWLFTHLITVLTKPKTPFSSVSLSTLSDVSLLTILEHLPVVELLRAQCLNRRLSQLVSCAARQRRSLIIDDGTWPLDYLKYTFPPTNVHRTFPPDTRLPEAEGSLRVPLTSADPAILRLQSVQTSESAVQALSPHRVPGSLPWKCLATGNLTVLFPHLIRLYVSVTVDSYALRELTSFLNASTPGLIHLHVRFRMSLNKCAFLPEFRQLPGFFHFPVPVWPIGYSSVATLCNNFLLAINVFSDTLRHLHLDLTPDRDSYLPEFTLQLPIVWQLESLYLRTRFSGGGWKAGTQQFDQMLRRLVSENPEAAGGRHSLRRFAIDSPLRLTVLLQVPNHLASRLVKVDIGQTITQEHLGPFARLCRRLAPAEGGGSLEDLTLSYTVPLYRLAEALAPLSKLVHLCLTERKSHQAEWPPGQTALVPLPSVSSLTLRHVHSSHAYLERLSLPVHFPQVRVVSVVNIGFHCVDCNHHLVVRSVTRGFDERLSIECNHIDQRFLRQNLPRLQALFILRRFTWDAFKIDSVERVT